MGISTLPTPNEEQTLCCVAPNQLLHQLGAKVPGHSSAQHFGGDFGKSETLHPAPGEKQTKPEKGSGSVEDLEHGLWLWLVACGKTEAQMQGSTSHLAGFLQFPSISQFVL
jgi:hypothetical protein